MSMIYLLDLFGVAVFSVTGSLSAGKKHLDLFGVVVVALATALGGGTLRDLILGSRVFWINDNFYIVVVLAAALITFVLARSVLSLSGILKIADAFGLAVFTVIGAQKALSFGASPAISIIMGVMTGVAGGMVRDVLSGEIPFILRTEIYATASLCGALVFVALSALSVAENTAIATAVIIVLALRLAAIKWQLSLPKFPD